MLYTTVMWDITGSLEVNLTEPVYSVETGVESHHNVKVCLCWLAVRKLKHFVMSFLSCSM